MSCIAPPDRTIVPSLSIPVPSAFKLPDGVTLIVDEFEIPLLREESEIDRERPFVLQHPEKRPPL
jgi:hypothetical protein